MRKIHQSPCLWLILLLLLTGASRPLSIEIHQRINQGLGLAQALSSPDLYRGQLVLGGGRIEEVVADQQGRLLLTLLPQALDARDRPFMEERGVGPFYLLVEDFAETELLRPGRMLTLAALVAGWSAAGGDFGPRPLLVAQEIHPWLTPDEIQARRPAPAHVWPGCCYDPWWPSSWCYSRPYRCW